MATSEHADMIARIDASLKENQRQMDNTWAQMSRYGEFGDRELTPAGKKRIATLVAERRELEVSAAAAYRI